MAQEEKPWHQKKEFLALRKQWYKKLKKRGFKDIEYQDWETGESGNLLNGFSLMDAARGWRPDKERFYQLAVHWLIDMRKRKRRKAIDPIDVKIWQLYSCAKSVHSIARELGTTTYLVTQVTEREKVAMLAAGGWDDDDTREAPHIKEKWLAAPVIQIKGTRGARNE